MNLACPASPADFGPLALEILETGSRGLANLLEVARGQGARFLQASTSEVYGEPLVHPQAESYWGNVNPVGPRSVYDEAKRFGEALTMAHHRRHGTEVRIARIFNTYGPGMRADDGRVVSNFVTQAIRGQPLTVYGDGSQTRSFCFVEDEARGLLALLDSGYTGPVNVGNDDERTMLEVAQLVLELSGSSSGIVFNDRDRWTTPRSAARTSRWPAAPSAGQPTDLAADARRLGPAPSTVVQPASPAGRSARPDDAGPARWRRSSSATTAASHLEACLASLAAERA